MKIQITKKSDRTVLRCTRDDGSYTQAELGPAFPMHDLAHFVVEKKLKLEEGFYGSIASGRTIQELSDRAFIQTLESESWLSEIMSRNLQSLGSGACTTDEYIELVEWEARLINNLQLPELTVDFIEDMKHYYETLCKKWDLLSYGENLVLRYSSNIQTIKTMERLQFEKEIKAPAEEVYRCMLGLDEIDTYEQWTNVFNPTSTYMGDWEKGSKMYFIGTDDEGNPGGMVSEVEEHIPYRHVAVRHYGILQGDEEVTEGPEVEQWAGGVESYSFEEKHGVTTVTIGTDVSEEYLDFFNETYPRGLDKLREIVENQ